MPSNSKPRYALQIKQIAQSGGPSAEEMDALQMLLVHDTPAFLKHCEAAGITCLACMECYQSLRLRDPAAAEKVAGIARLFGISTEPHPKLSSQS